MIQSESVAAASILPPPSPLAACLKGPYRLALREFTVCDDQGTADLRFDLRPRHDEAGERVFSGNVTLPQDLGPAVHGDVDIARWGTGGWGLHAFSLARPDACAATRRLAPGYFRSLAAALGLGSAAAARCPLPAGRYTVDRWAVGLSVPFPALPYGQYRVDVAYRNDTHRLGCVRWELAVLRRA